MRRTWEDNAREFGALSKQGKDMRLALLVACSVDKGSGQGGPLRGQQPRPDRAKVGVKVSARDFALAASTSKARVLRHLTAWNKLAKEGYVSADLKPTDASTYVVSDEAIQRFEDIFDASDSGGRPRSSVEEIGKAMATRPEFAKRMAPHIAKAMETPGVAQEVAAQASQAALGAVDIATSTESYMRRRAAQTPPPADAASHQLGGIGPAEMSDKLFNETMEPRLDSLYFAAKSAENQEAKFGFRMALTDVGEFAEMRDRLTEVGRLIAHFLDMVDAAEVTKQANEAEAPQ